MAKDLCMQCNKEHDAEWNHDEHVLEVFPEVENTAGHFCTHECSGEYAFDQLILNSDKREVRMLAFALNIIREGKKRAIMQMLSQVDAEQEYQELYNASEALLKLMGAPENPARYIEAWQSQVEAAMLKAF